MIRERGKAFEVRVYAGVIGGKKKWITETVPFDGGKRVARKMADTVHARIAAEIAAGKFESEDGKVTTVGELLDRYLEVATFDDKDGTRSRIERDLRPQLGSIRIEKLTTARVDQWTSQQQAHGGRAQKGLSASSVMRSFTVLRAALQLAVRYRWIDDNPCRLATKPKVSRRRVPKNVPSTDNVRQLIEQAEPDFAFLLRLAAVTGCRKGELCAFRRSHIVDGQLSVMEAVAKIKGGYVVRDHVKGGEPTRLRLDAHTLELLDQHYWTQESVAEAMHVDLADDPYVFSALVDCSAPFHPDTITRQFAKLRTTCKLEHVTLKNFRHRVATEIIGGGMGAQQVADRLNNDPVIAAKHYIQSIPAQDQAVADLLGALLD